MLTLIAHNDDDLLRLFDLDHATNDRLWAENGHLPGIASHELVFGVPHYGVINASFTHAHPLGSRFNGPDRGAWYAGFEIETAQAEMIFHKTREYAEINRYEDSVSYDDYLADFGGEYCDLRGPGKFKAILDLKSYSASQIFAARLLNRGGLGVVYPTVRRRSGTCLACFRPGAIGNVRKHYRYWFTWSGSPDPQVVCSSEAAQ